MKAQRLPDSEFDLMQTIWDQQPPVTTFYPIISRDEYLRMETENFLDHYHHKSVSSLIAALAGDRLSDQDLDELSDFVRKARERSEGK